MNNTYEQKALELDRELAGLLGWHRFYYNISNVLYGDKPNQSIVGGVVPRWSQDDGEAFRLAVEQSFDIISYKQAVKVMYDDGFKQTFESEQYYKDFPDKLSAVRYAIVQAVVNKLKGN